ncbi:DDE_4 domain-containing protein, partial [Cephalotus follicularis]
DCIGAIDGTYICVKVSAIDASRYRGKKEYPTQNVLAVYDFDTRFTYVLKAWEGIAPESRILKNALNRNNKLIIPRGKYYLGNTGFKLKNGLITPYR